MKNTINQNGAILTRKCRCCGEPVYIDNNTVNDAIYYDKTTYHSSCFIQTCECHVNGKRKNISPKWQYGLDNIDKVKQDSYQHFTKELVKQDIVNFILDSYDITIIPPYIFQKLSDIYSGSYRGMSCCIPPEHLLDMWRRKINMLNDIAQRNITKGMTMNSSERISYDLSVLINKYDSYLKWLERQKILEVEKKSRKSSIIGSNVFRKMVESYTIGSNSHSNSDDMSDDISNLVDDIFE